MDFDFIVTACHAETLLINTLGFPTKNHQSGDGQVINILDNNKKIAKTTVLIGVMDKPVGINPSHIPDKYNQIDTGPHNLVLIKKPNSKRYIIYINNLFEDWIKVVGESKNIQRPYPKDNSRFKNEMKSLNLKSNKTLVSYLNEINEANPTSFIKIKKWIKLIQNNKI